MSKRMSKKLKEIKEQKQWRVGEYLRLSKDDEANGTSLSIKNQRAIIHNFLEANPFQFTLAETYVDDGISGATAEHRPAFQRLIEDVKSELINCVVTNDTSRFARNVADAEYYINTIFPQYGVRFIALGSPRVDSYEDPESVDGMQFHFENYFNEYYVKTTSKKVLKVFEMKTRNGEFIGSHAPYGYVKDPINKNKLVVDCEAAEIVQKIFSMFVYDGLSLRGIAFRLNDMGILTPREYKIYKDIIPKTPKAKIPSWHYRTIKVILSDEKYCGHMVQGKTKKISYKIKKTKHQDPENWIIVRNTHEPIISEDLFQKAQILLVRPSRAVSNGEKSMYSGFLYCEKCTHTLNRGRRKESNKYYYSCNFHKETKKCRPLYISETALSGQLLYAVKSQIVLVAEMDLLKQQILASSAAKKCGREAKRATNCKAIRTDDNFIDDSRILKSNLAHLEKEHGKLEARSHKLYDDYSDGIIDKELYLSRGALLKQELETTKGKIAKIKIEMRQFKKIQSATDDYAEHFKKYETITEVTRELLIDLIDKIFIDKIDSPCGNTSKQHKHIRVLFKFANEHKALLAFIEENTRQNALLAL